MSTDRVAHVGTLEAPDVVGPGEVLAILNVGREAFRRYHRDRPDFPPARALECGLIYERRAIVAYQKQRTTGKPYLIALELYRDQRAAGATDHGAFAAIAGALEISHTTVRRYLQQLGEIPR